MALLSMIVIMAKNETRNGGEFLFFGGGYLGTAPGAGYPPVRHPGYVPAIALQWTELAERGLIQPKNARHL